MKTSGTHTVLQLKGAQTKPRTQTKQSTQITAVIPAPLLREMSKLSNLKFYRAFLQGEISDEKLLPHWVLPHLAIDGYWVAADCYFDSFTFPDEQKQGVALEYSLVFLEKRFKYAERWYAENSNIDDYGKFVESFDKLRGRLLGELERLDGYKIKTKWILDEIGRRFGD